GDTPLLTGFNRRFKPPKAVSIATTQTHPFDTAVARKSAERWNRAERRLSLEAPAAPAWLHADRAPRRHRHHRDPRGNPLPGVCASARERSHDLLPLEHEAVGPR